MTSDEDVPRGVDAAVASPARVYDYMLGGKDNYAADRAVAERMLQAEPGASRCIWQNRRFLTRAVRHLAEDAGMRQFLDIGAGLPTQDNVHQVARRHAPDARVVYVDNDPMVVAHARALMSNSAPDVGVVHADVRRPRDILDDRQVRSVLDFSEPVVLLLVAVLHFVPDDDDPYGIVRELVDALPPGSHVVISHGTPETAPDVAEKAREAYTAAKSGLALRTRDRIAPFFDGLQLLPPGLVWCQDWRPDHDLDRSGKTAGICAGVARKD